MTITNRLGLPEVLVRALARDPYSRGDSRYSVTQLIDAPRPRILKTQHAEAISRDISDSVWLLLGKGVHAVLESGAAAEGDPDHTVEERVHVKVRGVKLSGAMDVQRHPGGAAEIIDWKVTGWRTLTSEDRLKKWEEQLNLYRLFRVMAKDQIKNDAEKVFTKRANNMITTQREDDETPEGHAEKYFPGEVTKLTVVAFLRDWTKSQAEKKPEYPQSPIIPIDLRLWSLAEAHGFLHDRVKAHVDADALADIGAIPECTPEERWMRAEGWEVVQITKDGREWIRNSIGGPDAKALAEKAMADNIAKMKTPAKTWIREKATLPVRCLAWCEAAPFCEQWQAEKHLYVQEAE